MMSKNQKPAAFIFAIILFVFADIAFAAPTRLDIVIRLEKTERTHLKIEGKFTDSEGLIQKNFSIADSYADADALAKRLSSLRIFGMNGTEFAVKRFNDGEYTVEQPIGAFQYEFEPGIPAPLIAAPHVTWLDSNRALIKLHDLIPDLRADAYKIRFELPADWTISTNVVNLGQNEYRTDNLQNAVFLAGEGIRNQTFVFAGSKISVAVLDRWQFEDDEVAGMTKEILEEYRKLFGKMPRPDIQINLLPFPGEIEEGRWRAETQGGSVTIVSAPVVYRNRAPQRLHEQLRHELFHLWIPEALNLQGDYAWFYEGFARYQSLKAGVWVGRLSFDDFLVSMSEAINIASTDKSKLSSDGISGSQWLRGPGVISAKGMSVAFLCDALLLNETKGKQDVGLILNNIFREHAFSMGPEDGQKAVEAELLKYKILKPVVDGQINGTTSVDWKTVAAPLGIDAATRGGRTVLNVTSKPKGKQKALLNKLGYNRWKIFVR